MLRRNFPRHQIYYQLIKNQYLLILKQKTSKQDLFKLPDALDLIILKLTVKNYQIFNSAAFIYLK